jgi:hypothetical protein
MTSKFEQLIEYVINDEEQKARELFHDIVVEKSREIYENLMNEESEEEVEESMEDDEDAIEEGTSGDASQDLMSEVETDEMGMNEEGDEEAEFDDEAEEAGEEETKDIEADHDSEEGDIEDRVVDLEDKLDELMAEFEALMGDEAGEEMVSVDDEVGGDAYAQDDTAEFDDVPMTENISLPSAPKPVTTEPAGTNTKSTTAFNSGAAGMASKPVGASPDEKNPDGTASYKKPSNEYAKGEGNLPGAGSFKNVPAKDGSKLAPATKPTLSQAAGVNTKTPFPKG